MDVEVGLVNGDAPPYQKRCVKGRLVLKGGAVLVSAGAGVSYLPVSYNATKVKWLGVLLAYGNYTTWFVVDADAAWLMIDKGGLKLGWKGSVKLVGSAILGLAGRAPVSLYGLKYSKSVFWPGLTWVSDSFFTTLSWHRTLGLAHKKLFVWGDDRAVEKGRDALIGALKKVMPLILLMEDRLELLRDVDGLEGAEDLVGRFLEVPRPKRPSKKYRCGRFVARGIGLGLAGTKLYLTWTLAGSTMDKWTDKAGVRVAGQVFMTGSAAYEIVRGIVKVCGWGYERMMSCFGGRRKRSLGYHLKPKLYVLLESLGVITAALSCGGNINPSQQMYTGDFSVFMQATTGTALALVGAYWMTFTVEHICVWRGGKLDDEESRLLVEVQKKLNRLTRVIQTSPRVKVVRFLQLVPEGVLERLTGPVI